MGLHYLSTNANYGELQLIWTGLKRGTRAQYPDGSSMQVLIHAFHRVTPLHNNDHHDGFWYLRHRYPFPLGDDMDNRSLLQIGFDGHYVVYLRGLGAGNSPWLPDQQWPAQAILNIPPQACNPLWFDFRTYNILTFFKKPSGCATFHTTAELERSLIVWLNR